MADEAFFEHGDEAFHPAPHARSPWSAELIHGRLLGGLMARALDLEHGEPGLRPARLTVDLFRIAALAPLSVTTSRLRDGRRLRIADAVVTADGAQVARASAVFARESGQPSGKVWSPPRWDAPPPDELGVGPRLTTADGWRFPWTQWVFGDDNGSLDGGRGVRCRFWLREHHPLVAGETNSPFVGAALAADFASPISNQGSAGLQFINADYTLSLARLPIGDAIGMEAGDHQSADGIGVGTATVYDVEGPIGSCAVTAMASPGTGHLGPEERR